MNDINVIITMQDYLLLKDIKEKVVKAFNEKSTILYFTRFYEGSLPREDYAIVNESDIIKKLNDELKEVKEDRNNLFKELFELKNKKRVWF